MASDRPSVSTLLRLAWPMIVSRSTQAVIGVSRRAARGATSASAARRGDHGGRLQHVRHPHLADGHHVHRARASSSQLFGKGDLPGARRYAGTASSSRVDDAGRLHGGRPRLPLALAQLPYAPEVRELMTRYLQIRLLSGGAAMGHRGARPYYGGLGNTRLPMIASVFAMALNVALNWVLIGGHSARRRMGVAGSALASALATWVAFLGFWLFFVREHDAAGRAQSLASVRRARAHAALRPPVGPQLVLRVLRVQRLHQRGGRGPRHDRARRDDGRAADQLVSFMPAFGLASAGAILVGQSIGAGAKTRCRGIVRLTCATAVVAGRRRPLVPRRCRALLSSRSREAPSAAAMLVRSARAC